MVSASSHSSAAWPRSAPAAPPFVKRHWAGGRGACSALCRACLRCLQRLRQAAGPCLPGRAAKAAGAGRSSKGDRSAGTPSRARPGPLATPTLAVRSWQLSRALKRPEGRGGPRTLIERGPAAVHQIAQRRLRPGPQARPCQRPLAVQTPRLVPQLCSATREVVLQGHDRTASAPRQASAASPSRSIHELFVHALAERGR